MFADMTVTVAPSCLRAGGYDIRTVQPLLGRCDVRTTMVYARVLDRGPAGIRLPGDELLGALDASGRSASWRVDMERYTTVPRRLTPPRRRR